MDKKKVLILFAGSAGSQVADILLQKEDIEIVGFLDDTPGYEGKDILGIKVLGRLNILEKLFEEKVFNYLIIGHGVPKIRKEFYERYSSKGIPFINAIDESVELCSNVTLGEGNVLCGGVYIGNSAVIGNNNFISSHASIEHHTILGNHITSGPHLSTTGKCKIGNCVQIGMHVGLQYSQIGENVLVNSGIVVLGDIPENKIVKKKQDYIIS